MSAVDLTILIAGLGFAGLAKGATGMGLPLVATPILAAVFGPRTAVVIVTIPIFVSNSLLLAQGWRRAGVLRGLAPILLASAMGTIIGVQLLALLDQRTFAILIAVMVAIFLLRGDRLIGDDPKARRAQVLGPLVGFVGGLLQGTTSIASPLVGSFFHTLRLEPRDFVLTLAAVFELNAIIQVIGYALLGLFTPEVLALGLIGLVPTLLALMLGIFLRGRMDAQRFRALIVVLLVLSTLNLLYRTFAT